jgi:hypothetical protein
MNATRLILIGRLTALLSFLLGTGILLAYYQTNSPFLIQLGLTYIALAALVNIAILITIVGKSTKDEPNRKTLLRVAATMSLNIPVILVYCWFVLYLTGFERITLQNSTDAELTNLHLVGCEEKQIEKLGIGQHKTIWVKIPNDCTVSLQYTINGQQKEDVVVGYSTPGMGGKTDYEIGLEKLQNR